MKKRLLFAWIFLCPALSYAGLGLGSNYDLVGSTGGPGLTNITLSSSTTGINVTGSGSRITFTPNATQSAITTFTSSITVTGAGGISSPSIYFGGTALAYYAEGTFTPVLKLGGATTGITYGTQAGYYTRIGRMVQFQVDIILTSKGSATGQLTITGAPFSAATRAYTAIFGSAMTATYTDLMAEMDAAIWYPAYSTGGSIVGMDNTNITNTTTLRFTGTFFI